MAPHVIEGAAALPKVKTGGQSASHEAFRAANRLLDAVSLRQTACYGTGKRTAGSVGVAGRNALRSQPCVTAIGQDEQVVGGIGAMAALDEHRPVGFPGEQLRRLHHALVVGDGKTAQHLGLRHVRGDNVSQGHQVRDQRIDSLLLDETRAAGGHHDRVDHHVARLMEKQTLGDDVDDLGGGDHADLHRFGTDILEHRIDLRPDHFRRDILYRAHAAGVLRRNGGDDRFRI